MNARKLLYAIGQIDESYIEEAVRPAGVRLRGGWLRWGAAAAAAVLIFAATVGTAMAVSPAFRQMVLSFFRIGQAEQVPNDPGVPQGNIGGLVEAEYIQLEGTGYTSSGGALCQVERDGDGTVRGVRFWAVEDGAAVELEVHKSTFAVTWQDVDYRGDIYWCVCDEEISFYGDGFDGLSDRGWWASRISGCTDAVLLYLSQGGQINYREYPQLLSLDTGETEDILAGAGVEELELPYDYEWSDGLDAALITRRDMTMTGQEQIYYCDVANKALTELEALTGIVCDGAHFADNNTLLLFTEGEEFSVFAYDLTTGQAFQTLGPVRRFAQGRGLLSFGGRYGLLADGEGKLSAVDLKTGAQTPVEGFTLDGNGSFLSNRTGDKFAYYAADSAADGLGIAQLGVLDLKAGKFTAFDRVGYDGLREWSVGWFDNDRVGVRSTGPEGEVLYLYRF